MNVERKRDKLNKLKLKKQNNLYPRKFRMHKELCKKISLSAVDLLRQTPDQKFMLEIC